MKQEHIKSYYTINGLCLFIVCVILTSDFPQVRYTYTIHVHVSRCDTVFQMYGIGKGKAPEDDTELELENLNNYSNIPIDQVIEEASNCVDCYRTR